MDILAGHLSHNWRIAGRDRDAEPEAFQAELDHLRENARRSPVRIAAAEAAKTAPPTIEVAEPLMRADGSIVKPGVYRLRDRPRTGRRAFVAPIPVRTLRRGDRVAAPGVERRREARVSRPREHRSSRTRPSRAGPSEDPSPSDPADDDPRLVGGVAGLAELLARVFARVVRAVVAIEEKDVGLAYSILVDLEIDLEGPAAGALSRADA